MNKVEGSEWGRYVKDAMALDISQFFWTKDMQIENYKFQVAQNKRKKKAFEKEQSNIIQQLSQIKS